MPRENKYCVGPSFFTWLFVIGLALIGLFASLARPPGGDPLTVFFVVIGSSLIYFAPGLTAEHRRHRQRVPIYLLNLFLGWTLIGWVAALVWSTTTDVDREKSGP